MKIIKQGVIPEGFDLTPFECDECHCVFEATKYEFEIEMRIASDRYVEYANTKCPYCGNDVYKATGYERKMKNDQTKLRRRL